MWVASKVCASECPVAKASELQALIPSLKAADIVSMERWQRTRWFWSTVFHCCFRQRLFPLWHRRACREGQKRARKGGSSAFVTRSDWSVDAACAGSFFLPGCQMPACSD